MLVITQKSNDEHLSFFDKVVIDDAKIQYLHLVKS